MEGSLLKIAKAISADNVVHFIPRMVRILTRGSRGRKKGVQPLLFFGYALRPAKEEPLVLPRKGIEGIEGVEWGIRKRSDVC